MNKRLSDFLNEHQSFENLIAQYAQSFNYCQDHFNEKRCNEQAPFNNFYEQFKSQKNRRLRQIRENVISSKSSLDRILSSVKGNETAINDKRYFKFKESFVIPTEEATAQSHYTKQQIDEQARKAKESVNKLMQLKSIPRAYSYLSKSFRESLFTEIITNIDALEKMITSFKKDHDVVYENEKNKIEGEIAEQKVAIDQRKNQKQEEIYAEKQEYLKNLKLLLLDGIQNCLNSCESYEHSAEWIDEYLNTYLNARPSPNGIERLCIGFTNHNFNANDDGTLDSYLSRIFSSGYHYNNGMLLVPITLDKSFEKPISVRYSSDLSVYSLFENYALQMLNIFKDDDATIYLVDCTNMGGQYSSFTGASSDEQNRINIIRSKDELKALLNTLSDDIIEASGEYLRDSYNSIIEYNQSAVIKRPIKAVFFSDISELENNDMISKLESIARNGNRCGIYSFIGIPDTELEQRPTLSQQRIALVSNILDICDSIRMNSNTEMEIEDGGDSFIAPSKIDSQVKSAILERAVKINENSTVIPLASHIINESDYFTFDAQNGISIPIGLDAKGNEYTIDLKGDAAYMLACGDPHSGKSSLIHTIVLQALTRYGHDQLEIYLADLKDGVEFDIYARKGIKSVKAILNDTHDSDSQASFLKYIKSIVEKRNEIFRKLSEQTGENIRNIEQFYAYNNIHNAVPNLPRILLIVDEFQTLYSNNRETGTITNYLVRMCRTVGIFIIMASQRVQAAADVNNTFTNDTKDYFIHRTVLKCPPGSARQIVQETCSDTSRQNTAILKSPTLKTGQAIVNPSMGAIEEDNTLVQCYYPDNSCIMEICDAIVRKQDINHKSIVINSEEAPIFQGEEFFGHDGIILGVSNRLLYDDYCENVDVVFDRKFVGLKSNDSLNVLCTGEDKNVKESTQLAILSKLSYLHKDRLLVNILVPNGEETSLSYISCFKNAGDRIKIFDSVESFAENASSISSDMVSYNIICNIDSFSALQKDTWSGNTSEATSSFLNTISKPNTVNLLICDNLSELGSKYSYIVKKFNIRIASVGNISSIRGILSNDRREQIKNGDFNVITNRVKAYYYNASTDKLGKMKMYKPSELLASIDFDSFNSATDEGADNRAGFSGLIGN